MQIVNRLRIAFAVLTLAASAMTFVAGPTPALAAQTGPSNKPTPNQPHVPTPGPVQPGPGLPGTGQPGPVQTGNNHRYDNKPPLPDVSVTLVGHSGGYYGDSYMVVAYDLKTTGADANNVVLKSECNYHRFSDEAYRRKETKPNENVSLYASWPAAVPHTVTCSRIYDDEWISSVLLSADVPVGDANTSNNLGYWDAWTNK
jgi:hypothetical protein